uniref:Uncharacterized protein n=1 Tax=Oryza brachyantha TaxID=4533 RepID=J3LN34_ORYBR
MIRGQICCGCMVWACAFKSWGTSMNEARWYEEYTVVALLFWFRYMRNLKSSSNAFEGLKLDSHFPDRSKNVRSLCCLSCLARPSPSLLASKHLQNIPLFTV